MARPSLLRRWARRRVEQVATRVGALFVSTGYVLILGVAHVHFTSLVPRVALGTAERWAHNYVSAFLLAEVLLQFSLAVWSNPGYVQDTHAMGTKRNPDRFNVNGHHDEPDDDRPMCSKCGRVKPPRAHHCRVCRRCVYEMDHHCPWVNNCVGYRNYRHFWLLLLYLWVSCAYVASLSFSPFLAVLRDSSGRAERSTSERVERFALTFACLTTATLGVALFCYWLWHAYLVVTRQTTIEFAMGRRKQERYRVGLGAALGAVKRMLGRRDAWWFMALVVPPTPRELPPPYYRHAIHPDV